MFYLVKGGIEGTKITEPLSPSVCCVELRGGALNREAAMFVSEMLTI